MKFVNILTLTLLLIGACSQHDREQANNLRTLLVDLPTGSSEHDRNAIESILLTANEGDTVQFSPGKYKIGGKIQINANNITIKGAPEGTVIRGCDPQEFTDPLFGLLNCGGFELVGKSITVQNLTIEYAWHGLMVGCCLPVNMEELESGTNIQVEQPGGHIIQNNVFRFNSTGIRVIGLNPAEVEISNNVFQDNFHGLTINGANVHVRNNTFRSVTPINVPVDSYIDNAIGVLPFSSMFNPDNTPDFPNDCTRIEIAENTFESIPNNIRIEDTEKCKAIVLSENLMID